MREDGGDSEAAGALDIHEEGSGGRDKVLEEGQMSASALDPMFKARGVMMEVYLKLVFASLSGWGWVEEIDCENLNRQYHVSLWASKSKMSQFYLLSIFGISIPPHIKFYRYPIVLDAGVRRSCARFPLTDISKSTLGGRGFHTILAVGGRNFCCFDLTDGSFVCC